MFLHLTIYLLFGVFLGVVSAEDRQLVHSVEVMGSSGMMASRARSLLVTRPGMSIDSLMIKQDMKRLLKGYQEIGYWQYENPMLDDVGQRIFRGDFADQAERDALYREATRIA